MKLKHSKGDNKMTEKTITRAEYDSLIIQLDKLKNEVKNCKIADDEWFNTTDRLTISKIGAVRKESIVLCCNNGSWKNSKESNSQRPLYVKMEEEGHYGRSMALDIKEMIQLRDYLNQKIEYLDDCSDSTGHKMLEFSINNNVLVEVSEKNRDVGKTTALIKKANDYKCTLVVYGRFAAEYAKEQANRMGFVIEILCLTESHRLLGGLSMKNNKYLIDESVPLSVVKDLRGNKRNELIGGFISL